MPRRTPFLSSAVSYFCQSAEAAGAMPKSPGAPRRSQPRVRLAGSKNGCRLGREVYAPRLFRASVSGRFVPKFLASVASGPCEPGFAPGQVPPCGWPLTRRLAGPCRAMRRLERLARAGRCPNRRQDQDLSRPSAHRTVKHAPIAVPGLPGASAVNVLRLIPDLLARSATD